MRVALDTTNILGWGAVKDTYNLLAEGIVKLLRALAAVEQAPVKPPRTKGEPSREQPNSASSGWHCNRCYPFGVPVLNMPMFRRSGAGASVALFVHPIFQ